MNKQDTIAALATPVGSAAIGVIRLSGPQAIAIADKLFQPYSDIKKLSTQPGFCGLLGRVQDDGEEIDEVIATVYRAPKSYTGEDSVELSCHGSPFILDRVLELCVLAGARPAQAGEFTKRAFLNGKLELSQAEAVCDLINAQSEGGRRAALAGRDGVLSIEIGGMVEILSGISAHMAAWADYPEEDLVPVDEQELSSTLTACWNQMTGLLQTYGKGRLLREGISTAIVGKPNVGKSTLMNLLAGHRRSIVTDIPGTTRDIVQETVRLGDYLLRLLDTAGIRDTSDVVEREGVQLAREQIKSAQLVLAVFDSSVPLDCADRELLEQLDGVPCIAVVNKSDLPRKLDLEEIRNAMPNLVLLSADTGAGKEQLETEIVRLLGLDTIDPAVAMIANARQHHSLALAAACLEEACSAISAGITLDAVNVSIDGALDHLLELTGQRATEKVVDEVFARFCVGK